MQVRFGLLPQLRRDAAMLWRELRGDIPAPFHPRQATRARVTAPLATRRLRVAELRRETATALTLLLEDPTGAALDWQPGQFFTPLLPLPDGTTLRRAYSAAMPPRPGAPLPLTVKRQPDGRGSSFVHDRLRRGDVLEVLGPSGSFVVPADAAARPLVLVGGGSGITPLSAILHAALAGPDDGPPVTLVYANRAEDDVIFGPGLAELAARHPARFTLRHVIGASFDPSAVPVVADAEYFVCGPAPMMDATRASLLERGVVAARVHVERFASPATPAADDATSLPQPVVIRFPGGGAARTVVAAPGQTLLEAGLAAGVPMPYSCAMGGCGACRVTLAAGTVAAADEGGLTADERARGLVLACCSRPTSPCTLEVPR